MLHLLEVIILKILMSIMSIFISEFPTPPFEVKSKVLGVGTSLIFWTIGHVIVAVRILKTSTANLDL